jgi:hypothetical protein
LGLTLTSTPIPLPSPSSDSPTHGYSLLDELTGADSLVSGVAWFIAHLLCGSGMQCGERARVHLDSPPTLPVTLCWPLRSQDCSFLLMQKACICSPELSCMHSCSALGNDIGMALTLPLLFFSEKTTDL